MSYYCKELTIFIYLLSTVVLATFENTHNKGNGKIFSEFSHCHFTPKVCPNENITFWLFTRETQDKPVLLDLTNSDSNLNASFVPDVPTKILIHGYDGSRDGPPNQEIRPAYFETGDYNIISVDYGKLVVAPCYLWAVTNSIVVGNCTAQLIDFLVEKAKIPLDTIHVIGFSLGGQVAGLATNFIKSGPLTRITGLDPALPLFFGVDKKYRLDSSDALFVDVIHTDVLSRGKLLSSGTIDFYVNGGMKQPGCLDDPTVSLSSCNHARAPLYYAASINKNATFLARKCSEWVTFVLGLCKLPHDTDKLIMGEYVNKTASGKYFLKTSNKPPYALGESGIDF